MSERKVLYRKVNGKTLDDKGDGKDVGGSDYSAFNDLITQQTAQSHWAGHADADGRDKLAHATAGVMMGIAPRDEMEGMLAAQMVATHNAAMECYRRAMLPDQTFGGREMALTQANKLTRSYSTMMLALDKHRGKGQQKVTVEHVHVGDGGRAIFGDVHHGGRQQPEAAPAQLTHSSLQPMPMVPSRTARAAEALSESLVGVGVEQNDDD